MRTKNGLGLAPVDIYHRRFNNFTKHVQKSRHGQKFGMLVSFVVCLGIIHSYNGKGLVGLGQKLNNFRDGCCHNDRARNSHWGRQDCYCVKEPARSIPTHPATVAEVM